MSFLQRAGEKILNGLSLILVAFGLWLILDGVYSMFRYRGQTFPEQLIRAIRAAVGVAIVFFGFF